MSRRHNSLIPLSHQHQHALAMAVIIRRRFGLEKGDEVWQAETTEKVRKLYSAELAGHFEVEETVLFPEMERYLGPLDLVAELRQDHETLRNLVERLDARGGAPLQTLGEFAALLEQHVRKEERRLFPEFEKRIPLEEALRIGREIDARLARACPRL